MIPTLPLLRWQAGRLCLLLAVAFLTPSWAPAAPNSAKTLLPAETSDWPVRVFADPEAFSTGYDAFFDAHFRAATAEAPAWLDIDPATLAEGEHALARTVVLTEGNRAQVRERLLALVTRRAETGLTQFHADPAFPKKHFVLGHQGGRLSLVAYDAYGVEDPLWDDEALDHLAERGAFVTREPARDAYVVVSRGDHRQVDVWYPRIAAQVMHTHTIEGNLRPTGYDEYFSGSDRDLAMSAARAQVLVAVEVALGR